MPYAEDLKPEDVQWCDTCRDQQAGHCGGCNREFDASDRMIYKSQSCHFHPGTVLGIPGSMGIYKKLCVECYRIDFAKVYPKTPVPSLPDRVPIPRPTGATVIAPLALPKL